MGFAGFFGGWDGDETDGAEVLVGIEAAAGGAGDPFLAGADAFDVADAELGAGVVDADGAGVPACGDEGFEFAFAVGEFDFGDGVLGAVADPERVAVAAEGEGVRSGSEEVGWRVFGEDAAGERASVRVEDGDEVVGGAGDAEPAAVG